jgi:hypothetical protein
MMNEFYEGDEESRADDESGDPEVPIIPVADPNPSSSYADKTHEKTNRTPNRVRNALHMISPIFLRTWMRLKSSSFWTAAFWTAAATVVIALTSYYQWKAIKGQLGEMQKSGSQTDKIIDAANQIKCALITANKQNAEMLGIR